MSECTHTYDLREAADVTFLSLATRLGGEYRISPVVCVGVDGAGEDFEKMYWSVFNLITRDHEGLFDLLIHAIEAATTGDFKPESQTKDLRYIHHLK